MIESTREVAKKLIRFCREKKHKKALEELYADHCTSREMPGTPDEYLVGKAAIVEKNNRWFEAVKEFHECDVSDPVLAGEFFSCLMTIDVTFYGRKRMELEEICVYEVSDGQIVSEQFFYSMLEEQ
ncbi:MAG: SnoaL-like domain-containing protein [Planctomycetota bacterium]